MRPDAERRVRDADAPACSTARSPSSRWRQCCRIGPRLDAVRVRDAEVGAPERARRPGPRAARARGRDAPGRAALVDWAATVAPSRSGLYFVRFSMGRSRSWGSRSCVDRLTACSVPRSRLCWPFSHGPRPLERFSQSTAGIRTRCRGYPRARRVEPAREAPASVCDGGALRSVAVPGLTAVGALDEREAPTS